MEKETSKITESLKNKLTIVGNKKRNLFKFLKDVPEVACRLLIGLLCFIGVTMLILTLVFQETAIIAIFIMIFAGGFCLMSIVAGIYEGLINPIRDHYKRWKYNENKKLKNPSEGEEEENDKI